jgi:hypothetical protein
MTSPLSEQKRDSIMMGLEFAKQEIQKTNALPLVRLELGTEMGRDVIAWSLPDDGRPFETEVAEKILNEYLRGIVTLSGASVSADRKDPKNYLYFWFFECTPEINVGDELNKIAVQKTLEEFGLKYIQKSHTDKTLQVTNENKAKNLLMKLGLAGNDLAKRLFSNGALTGQEAGDLFNKLYEASTLKKESPAQTEQAKCFIATACYGTYDAPEVRIFRRFRDETILKAKHGNQIVGFYYKISPPFAYWLDGHQLVAASIRYLILDPIAKLIGSKYK